jgi:hypothetical protein
MHGVRTAKSTDMPEGAAAAEATAAGTSGSAAGGKRVNGDGLLGNPVFRIVSLVASVHTSEAETCALQGLNAHSTSAAANHGVVTAMVTRFSEGLMKSKDLFDL